MPERLLVEHLTVRWEGRPVVEDLSIDVAAGEVLAVLGPNGSGKTTLLRALAGLEPSQARRLELGGRDLSTLATHRRSVGLVFQEPALLPGRSVRENIAFGPEIQRVPSVEVAERVADLAHLLHLEPFLDRSAHALSGGERQRVALARALAPRPGLLLLDEPFASVDPELRRELRAEFRAVLRSVGTTAIHVTHDREEAVFLGDRLAVLMAGRVRQLGPPEEVVQKPRSAEVARFLGFNLHASASGTEAVSPSDLLEVPDEGLVRGTVVTVGPVENGWLAYVDLREGGRWEWRGGPREPRPSVGASVALRWTAGIPVASDDPTTVSRVQP